MFGIISKLGGEKAGRPEQVQEDGHKPPPFWQGKVDCCHTTKFNA